MDEIKIKQLPVSEEHTCAFHKKNKDGKNYESSEILPHNMCPWLYHTLYPYYLTLLHGGKFDWNERGGVQVGCPAAEGINLVVKKRDNDGKVLFTIGERGKPSAWQEGDMFNRPTDIIVHPKTGELFISDGYGNSRVHKLSPEGKHIKSWGVPGSGDGEFSLPHNISMIGDDKVIVADRENFRLQIFSIDGEYLDQWHIHHPMSVTEGKNDDKNLYVGEMGPPEVQHGVPGLGNRIVVLNPDGERITHFGNDLPGQNPDQFVAPHGVTTDSKGNVYVGEVAWTFWYSKKDPQPLGELVSLRKWIKK